MPDDYQRNWNSKKKRISFFQKYNLFFKGFKNNIRKTKIRCVNFKMEHVAKVKSIIVFSQDLLFPFKCRLGFLKLKIYISIYKIIHEDGIPSPH